MGELGRGLLRGALFQDQVDKILSSFPKRKTVTKLIKPTPQNGFRLYRLLAVIERNKSHSGRNLEI